MTVIVVLQLLEFYLDYRSLSDTVSNDEEEPNRRNVRNERGWLYYVRQAGKHYIYVFGNLLSQGLG
jgi:hypothetical protein